MFEFICDAFKTEFKSISVYLEKGMSWFAKSLPTLIEPPWMYPLAEISVLEIKVLFTPDSKIVPPTPAPPLVWIKLCWKFTSALFEATIINPPSVVPFANKFALLIKMFCEALILIVPPRPLSPLVMIAPATVTAP